MFLVPGAVSPDSDPGMFVVKYAHGITCLRHTPFTGPIQQIFDESAFFSFDIKDIHNLRIDSLTLMDKLQLKFLTMRKSTQTDTTR